MLFKKVHFSIVSKKKKKIQLNYYLNDYFDFLIFARHSGIISNFQILIIERLVLKLLQKQGQFYLKTCCNIPITKKPLESRMGKGKGKIFHYICFFYPGKLLFLLKGVSLFFFKTLIRRLEKQLSFSIIINFF